MIWGAICRGCFLCYKRCIGNVDSVQYCSILESTLLPAATSKFGADYILQQDNASVHTSKYTMQWMESKNITVMSWPARSPDLSPIENLWSVVARRLYSGGKEYKTIYELSEAIDLEFKDISKNYVDTLYDSIPSRLIEVVAKGGGLTKY